MKQDRPYNTQDLRVLKGMRAAVEDDDFHATYLKHHDIWCRGKHENAEMQQAVLHMLVFDWESKRERMAKARAAKGTKELVS